MKQNFFRTSDEASIFYEVQGQGQPLVLVHGWSCSSKFYEPNVAELQNHFQVVTLDLRGHGRSTKGLHGLTIKRLARDVHELIEFLKLEDVILMGWSLGGPVLLAYWEQFKHNSHLRGMGLIDMTPFPFSSAEWNSHGFRNYNTTGLNTMIYNLLNKTAEFNQNFSKRIFKDGIQPPGYEWVEPEMTLLPPYIGIALYSDYCHGDYTDTLADISIPTLVLAADSPIFPRSIAQGEWIAKQIPQGSFIGFYEGGHMLFHVEAAKFNQTVINWVKTFS